METSNDINKYFVSIFFVCSIEKKNNQFFSVVDVLVSGCIFNNAFAYQHTIFFDFIFISVSGRKDHSKLCHSLYS